MMQPLELVLPSIECYPPDKNLKIPKSLEKVFEKIGLQDEVG